MEKKITMNIPSVWTDQILWRRTVQENSLSRRARTKWAWNTISLHSSSAGHKPNQEKRNKCRGQEHQLAKHKWSHDAAAWGCSFLARNTNPSICLLPAAPEPWNVPCRAPGKPAPATGRGFRHFCWVTEEAWNELSTMKEASWVFQEYFAFLYNTSTFNEVNPSQCH